MGASIGTGIAGFTSVDQILKEFYLGPIINQLNNEILAVELFQKAQVDWQGKRAVIPVKVSRNSGVSFLAEGAALPTAGEVTKIYWLLLVSFMVDSVLLVR